MVQIVSLILTLSNQQLIAQTFQPDKRGYVADPKFRAFIKANGYQLVGAFQPVAASPLPSRQAPLVAQAVKDGQELYISTAGAKVDLNSLRGAGYNYSGPVSGAPDVQIDGPVGDNNEQFEQFVVNGKIGTKNKATQKPGLPAIYDQITWWGHGLVEIKLNGLEGFAKTDGKILLEPKYESISGYGVQDKNGTPQLFYIRLKGKAGLMDGSFKEIIAPEYDLISSLYVYPGLFMVQTGQNKGLVSRSGKLILPVSYTSISAVKAGLPLIIRAGLNSGLADSTGKILIEPAYQEIQFKQEDQIFKLTKAGKYGLADKTGQVIVPAKLDYIFDFKNGVAIVEQQAKYGAVALTGNYIIPVEYDKLGQDGNYILGKKGNAVSLFDLKGKSLLSGNYEALYPVNDQLLYKSEGRFGLMTFQEKKLKKLDYDDVLPDHGYLIVSKNAKYGVIDSDGRELVPVKYDKLLGDKGYIIKQGIVQAELDGRRLFVDFYGDEFSPVR